MLLRIPLLLSAVALVLALPAAGHAAIVTPTAVSAETTVPAGGTRVLTLSCPAPSVALSAAVTRLGRAARLRRSTPGTNAADWRLRFAAGRGASRRVEAELRCVRLRLPSGVSGAGLEIRTRSADGVRIAPGESEALDLGCGAGYAATGYGIDRGRRGDVRVAAAVPRARGWRFELENVGSAAARAGVSVRCLKREVDARREGERVELHFDVVRRRFEDVVVQRGRVSFIHSCRRGQWSVATGSEVDPLDAIALVRSAAAGARSASWTFARARSGDDVTNHLVCLGRGSRFR
jgi:hypothetical protein